MPVRSTRSHAQGRDGAPRISQGQTAETIAIGSELLRGGSLDTNSMFVAERLGELGIEVKFKSIVGDEEDAMANTIAAAVARVDLLIITGGLGPTVDDRTREAVARVTGRPLRRSRPALQMVRDGSQPGGGVPVLGNCGRRSFHAARWCSETRLGPPLAFGCHGSAAS